MTTINKARPTMRDKAHANYMGGPSYDLSPFARLYVMASSSFFGEPSYYFDVSTKDEATRTKRSSDEIRAHMTSSFGSFGKIMNGLSAINREEAMKKAFEDSLEYDPELTLKFLGWLRNHALIRATSDVGLAIASHSDKVRGTGLLRTAAVDVLSRLDDVTNCLAYYINTYGKPIPNSLKKALADRVSRAREYELAKYTAKNKQVSLMDVIRLTHAHSDAVDKFYRGEISQKTAGQETWEAIISTEGSNHDTWTKAVGVMGHMALLRNLRNLEKFEVDPALYLDKLVDGVPTGKQLPFRYYSAWSNVTNAATKKVLEKCIDVSISNLPILPGKSLILVDNSGSALGAHVSKLSNVNVATCGNLMGILTGLVSDEGKIGVFGDTIKYMPINKNFTGTSMQLLNTVNDIGHTVGGATENGIWLALDDIIEAKEHYDRIFIYSDMQAGHGGLYGFSKNDPRGRRDKRSRSYPVFTGARYGNDYIDVPKLVAEYRSKVNKDCKLYSIQIGGYADNILPEFYPNTCIMSGWSQDLLKFVNMFEQGPENIENLFRKMFAAEGQNVA